MGFSGLFFGRAPPKPHAAPCQPHASPMPAPCGMRGPVLSRPHATPCPSHSTHATPPPMRPHAPGFSAGAQHQHQQQQQQQQGARLNWIWYCYALPRIAMHYHTLPLTTYYHALSTHYHALPRITHALPRITHALPPITHALSRNRGMVPAVGSTKAKPKGQKGRGGSFILRPVGIRRPWAALGPPLFVVVHRGVLLIKGINKHKKVARAMHPRLLHNARPCCPDAKPGPGSTPLLARGVR
jgi:hypothetical protein